MLLQVSGSQLAECVCVCGQTERVSMCKCASMEEVAVGMKEMS